VRELEFLPEEYLRARFQRRIGFLRSWLVLVIGLAMVLYSLQMGTWVRDARAELRALWGTTGALESDVRRVRDLQAEASGYRRRLEVLQTLAPRLWPSDVLAEVVAVLPPGVALEAVDLMTGADSPGGRAHLAVTGIAGSQADVTETLAALEASPRFCGAVLVGTRGPEGPDGWHVFRLRVRVLPRPSAEEASGRRPSDKPERAAPTAGAKKDEEP